jgi:hypothetical protein
MTTTFRKWYVAQMVNDPAELAQLGVSSFFTLGFGLTGELLLDGKATTEEVVGVRREDVQSWMTGLRWNLVSIGNGDWGILNQDNVALALTAQGNRVFLNELKGAWVFQGQRWTLLHDARRGLFQLRNRGGGWLSVTDNVPNVLSRTTQGDESQVSWRLEDPSIFLG